MPLPLLPIAGAVLVGSAIGAGFHRLFRGQPKSVVDFVPDTSVRASLKGDNPVSYTGRMLDITENMLVLGVEGGTLKLAMDGLDKVEVLT